MENFLHFTFSIQQVGIIKEWDGWIQATQLSNTNTDQAEVLPHHYKQGVQGLKKIR